MEEIVSTPGVSAILSPLMFIQSPGITFRRHNYSNSITPVDLNVGNYDFSDILPGLPLSSF